MLDIGWTEMLVVAVVAIVVVGPKDLPRLLRTAGGYVGKVRRMAGEFQRQLNDAVRESELEDVRKEVQAISASGDKMAADVNRQMRIPPKPSGAPIRVVPAPAAAAPAAVAGAAAPAAVTPDPAIAAADPAPAIDGPAIETPAAADAPAVAAAAPAKEQPA